MSPTPKNLERARQIVESLIADPVTKDSRGDVEEWLTNQLDAVQQPLRDQIAAMEKQRNEEMTGTGDLIDGICSLAERAEASLLASQARVAELETALDRAEALGQSHYQGMHTAKAEVEALRRERDNALDAANHMQQTLALYSVHKEGPVSE